MSATSRLQNIQVFYWKFKNKTLKEICFKSTCYTHMKGLRDGPGDSMS